MSHWEKQEKLFSRRQCSVSNGHGPVRCVSCSGLHAMQRLGTRQQHGGDAGKHYIRAPRNHPLSKGRGMGCRWGREGKGAGDSHACHQGWA